MSQIHFLPQIIQGKIGKKQRKNKIVDNLTKANILAYITHPDQKNKSNRKLAEELQLNEKTLRRWKKDPRAIAAAAENRPRWRHTQPRMQKPDDPVLEDQL